MQGSRLDMFSPLCKAAKLACSYHFARQRSCHVLTTLQGSKLDIILPLCKAAHLAWSIQTPMPHTSVLRKVLPLCKAANLAWSEKASSSWASAPKKSSSRMGVADAVVSTFHIVLFSGMDLVLPASRMFHQLRTSGVCTAAPTHHQGYYPSQGAGSSQGAGLSQGVLPITRGTTHHKGYYPSQGADSSHGLLVITRGRVITRDSAHHMGHTHHKLPPLIQKCNHSSQNLLVIKCQYPTVWWS